MGKAVELTTFFTELKNRHKAVLAALDHIAIGMIVLDRKGRVVVSNVEAKRILDEGHGIYRNSNSTLACVESSDDILLRSAISSVCLGLSHDSTQAESILTLRRDTTAEPVIVELSPLQDGRRELESFSDGVLVQLIDVGSQNGCDLKRFALAWGLASKMALRI